MNLSTVIIPEIVQGFKPYHVGNSAYPIIVQSFPHNLHRSNGVVFFAIFQPGILIAVSFYLRIERGEMAEAIMPGISCYETALAFFASPKLFLLIIRKERLNYFTCYCLISGFITLLVKFSFF